MTDAIRVCKVCGIKYPYCTTKRSVDGVFRWQDVACCPEHGSKYLAEIMKSRSESSDVSFEDELDD